MGRIFTSAVSDVASGTAIKDLIEIIAATNVLVIVHSIKVSSVSITDEKFLIELFRLTTTGSGGTAGVERPHDQGYAAADSLIEFNNTTQATKSGVLIDAQEWSNIIPLELLPFPEDRIEIEGGGGLIVELARIPVTGVNMTQSMTWEEFG